MPIGVYKRTLKNLQNLKKGQFKKGHQGYWKDKYHSLEHCKKIGDTQRDKPKVPCPLERRKRISDTNRIVMNKPEMKQKISRLTKIGMNNHKVKQKLREANKGEKSYRWKGGVTPLYRNIRDSFMYRQWKESVYKRDDFTCQDCGQYGGKNLRAHHIKSFDELCKEAKNLMPLLSPVEASFAYTPLWDVSNGVILCEKCHQIRHRRRK